MILLQLSSAQGPEECCLAVKKALDRLIKEATRQDVAVTVLETCLLYTSDAADD